MNPAQIAQANQEAADKELHKLDNLTKSAGSVLYSLSSVFPFQFFPTVVCVEKTKIDIIQKFFLGSERVRSVLIREVSSVEVETTWFFASLIIRDRMPDNRRILVPFLRKDEAFKAQNIIQGLMIGITQHIDVAKVPAHQLSRRVEQLGAAKATS